MFQEFFRIPFLNIPIYGYGVMLVIGFLLALQLAKFLARRAGLDPEVFVNAGLIALVAGIFGARLSHVIENLTQYTNPARTFSANFFDAVNIRSGGLTFYGGLILAFPMVIAYGIYKRIPIRLGMDIVAPCVMVGLGIGRIGCFVNGCCYGAECNPNFPLAVTFPYHSNAYMDQIDRGELRAPDELLVTIPGSRQSLLVDPVDVRKDATLASVAKSSRSLPVHPSQLYSTFTALLIAAILVCFYSLKPPPGRVMALMLMLEGTTRFILEMLRIEPPVTHVLGYGWSLSMVLGALLLSGGVVMWFICADRSGRLRAIDPRLTFA